MAIAEERTSLQTTMEMLRFLNDEQLAAIQTVARAFISDSREQEREHYRPLSEEEFFARVNEGLEDIKNGRHEDINVVEKRLRKEYGF
jgi:hypothetical protein